MMTIRQAYPKLIVVSAFDRDNSGNLVMVYGPRTLESEESALLEARALEESHAGVIAFIREADEDLGAYGPPKLLHAYGAVSNPT